MAAGRHHLLGLLPITALAGLGVAFALWWRQRPVPVAVDLLLVGGAAWDPTVLYSAELFLEENPSSRIRLETLFNRSDPTAAPASIAALKTRGVRFFLSTHPSSHALASLEEFSRGDALAINSAAASSRLSRRDDFFLRVVPDVHQEQQAIARALQRLGDHHADRRRRLLVLQDTANPAYGDSALLALRTELARLGGWDLEVRPLQVSSFAPGRHRKLMEGDIDALYILAGLFQPAIGPISQLFHQLHPKAPIVVTPWARSPAVFSGLGPSAASTWVASSYPSQSKDPELRAYLQRFQRRFGFLPNSLAISSRQAIELLDQALASGAQTPADVKRYLLSPREHRTSLGPVRFDAFGDRAATFHVFPAVEERRP